MDKPGGRGRLADDEQAVDKADDRAGEQAQELRDREREERRRRREEWAEAGLARQTRVLDDLAQRAEAANGAGASGPVAWAAVERQASSYLRHLGTWRAGRGFDGIKPVLDAYQARMEARVAEARAGWGPLPHEGRQAAVAGVGVRVAIIGKGGAGKTVISSTLARTLARKGRRVFVADLDTNPGLSYSLGMKGADIRLPEEAVEAHPGAAYGWQLRSDLLPHEVVEQYAIEGPDGVMVSGLGKIGEEDKAAAKQTVVALVQLLLGFGDPGWDVIADLEAGPTTPFERYHAFSDHVGVVVGPAWRSAMTARRLLPMVGDGRTTTLVANRFRDEPDHPALAPYVRIPFSEEVAEAERQGLSPLDACPDSPTIRAIENLADYFITLPNQLLEVPE